LNVDVDDEHDEKADGIPKISRWQEKERRVGGDTACTRPQLL
jgi:hypothetical protein